MEICKIESNWRERGEFVAAVSWEHREERRRI
jgi:hypothetical protein